MMSRRDVSDIVRQWKNECHITHMILFSYRSGVLTICTDKPGIMIGYMGETVGKYNEILKSKDKNFKTVNFIETDGIV
jgi:hypothetical protein